MNFEDEKHAISFLGTNIKRYSIGLYVILIIVLSANLAALETRAWEIKEIFDVKTANIALHLKVCNIAP